MYVGISSDGLQLVPLLRNLGFFRVTALRIGDYGNKWTVLTKPMYDEFKADMDQLVKDGELKEMPEKEGRGHL